MMKIGFIAGLLGGIAGLIMLGMKEVRVHSGTYSRVKKDRAYEYGMEKS